MKAGQTVPGTVDEYIAEFPRAVQAVLRKVRRAIRKGIPGAEEAISYRIPAFKVNGRVAIYFAGWKAHYSIYPSTARLVAAFRKELAPYEVNDRGTIRFPLNAPVPLTLIEGLARFRAKETVEGTRTKAARRAGVVAAAR
jgi:uncharacterized protein YdhG (YjbR/CyaY superfamily)